MQFARCLQAPLLGRGGGEALDFTHCPDIAQTLAVTYCLLGVPYVFKGVHSLRIKETDRVGALITELRKLGYVLRAEGDERLLWDGTRCEPETCPVIATYDDHRMAMALLVAGYPVDDTNCIKKSYPEFLEQWQKQTT